MEFIIMIAFFVFGLVIGSFLNVVVYRYNTEKSLGGRSACMSCRVSLSWYELIPVLSFIFLAGRCKSCSTKIALQYPLVELVTGVIFLALFLKFEYILYLDFVTFGVVYFYYALLFSILLVIAVYDLKHKIIPDTLSLTFGVLAFLGMFFFGVQGGSTVFYWHIPTIWQFLSGAFVALPFFLFWLLSRGTWMGLGDAKLAVGIGWMLGAGRLFSGVAIGFWSGALVGILLMILSRKYKLKSEIPFAPYLVLGAFLAFVFELNIFNIYF